MRLDTEKELIEDSNQPLAYSPRTPLGEKLLAIRAKIVASGESLLTQDEIEKEIATLRGEQHDQSL